MCSYGVLFLPVNFLFLSLGILLLMLYGKLGIALPAAGDQLLSGIIFSGVMGEAALIFFTVGVVASAFSSADSALTALTTSFCVDMLELEKDQRLQFEAIQRKERIRKRVHIGMMAAFLLLTLLFNAIGGGSVMDLIYTLVGYTYGPLLGLFAFGLLTKWSPKGRGVILVSVLSPLLCLFVDYLSQQLWSYKFGYEMLLFNGLLTFIGLWLLPRKPYRF